MAANPCPCGQGSGKGLACTCTPLARRRYLARLSGPLLDRIDIQMEVPALTRADLAMARVSADRKSTRLNSSHVAMSYAVFCLQKKHRKSHSRRAVHQRN